MTWYPAIRNNRRNKLERGDQIGHQHRHGKSEIGQSRRNRCRVHQLPDPAVEEEDRHQNPRCDVQAAKCGCIHGEFLV